MPSFLIKNLPAAIHEQLRRRAAEQHRSMNREVIAILQRELTPTAQLPPPVKLKEPIDSQTVVRIIRDGRDSRP